MNRSLKKYFLGCLLLVLAGVSMPWGYAQSIETVTLNTTVRAGNFAPGELQVHYLKHGYQFGNITEEQYLEGAQALLDAEPGGDVLEKIRYNGDIEHFRVSTGEFAVMTRRGRIRTYFKTSYGYWLDRP